MKAFLGKIEIKEKFLKRIEAHKTADEIIKGMYWENGKGCAVGCTIHSDDHSAYETELGIPEWLALVEDTIFEGLPDGRAKDWPFEFLSVINVGADLEKIKTPFIIFILESALESMLTAEFDEIKFPEVKKEIEQSSLAVQEMIRCHRDGIDLSAAAMAVLSAKWAARSVLLEAKWAAKSAELATKSAAWSVLSVELATMSAAWSAAASAESVLSAKSAELATKSAAWSAESSAWSIAHVKFADKLLELLSDAK